MTIGRNWKIKMAFHIIFSKYEIKFVHKCFISFDFSKLRNESQWDHSEFAEIRQKLDDCNYVKYSMYRVALKFRVLQKALFSKYISNVLYF